MELLNPGTATQNIAAAVRAKGPLDVALLERCINVVIQRHEALRTNFVASGDGPRQLIFPSRRIAISERDITQEFREQGEAALYAAIIPEAYKPFTLSSGSLIRVTSLRTGEDDRVLLLTMHHIIGDEWSIGVLLEELGTLYACDADPAALPELPVQYADYAEWQAKEVTPAALRSESEYWSGKLAGAGFSLEVPTDRPRPRVQTTNGSMEAVLLPANVSEGVTALARTGQFTKFMTMLAAFDVLLHARTGKQDIIVGTDFANRNRHETAKLIGFFVNELALRVDLTGDPSFRQLVQRVRTTSLEAFNHQEIPFQWVVEELRPPRDPSRSPVFQVVFDLHNIPMQLEFRGISFQPLRLPLRPAKFDITLFISESPSDLYALLEYNTDLYDTATAKRFLSDYVAVLEQVVSDPGTRLSEFRTMLSSGRN